MRARVGWRLSTLIAGVLPVIGAVGLPSAVAAPAGPGASTEMATSLLLSASQYKRTIADIFGDSIKIDGRFEPEQRDQGMLAIGARTENVSDSGVESYDD